jgi:hypothetical protein
MSSKQSGLSEDTRKKVTEFKNELAASAHELVHEYMPKKVVELTEMVKVCMHTSSTLYIA